MPWYSINTSIMIPSLRTSTPVVKQVWLADDSAGGGQIVPLYNWYSHLSQEGKTFGYLVNGSKSWLIVKSDVLADEAKRVFGDEIDVTTEGQRHLGAVIGSQEFKDQYCREKILRWKGELEALSEIARSQPHAAYTVESLSRRRVNRVSKSHPRVVMVPHRVILPESSSPRRVLEWKSSRPRRVLKYRLKIRVSIYLFLSVGRKMTRFPETVSDPRSPSLVISVSSLLWHTLKEG